MKVKPSLFLSALLMWSSTSVVKAELYYCKRTSSSTITEKETYRSSDDKEVFVNITDDSIIWRFKDWDSNQQRSEKILMDYLGFVETDSWVINKNRSVARFVVQNMPTDEDSAVYVSFFRCD